MSFDLKKFTPYELAKRNNNNIQNNIKPSDSEYRNVVNIVNTQLTQKQYEQLYSMYLINLPENRFSVTTIGIQMDAKRLTLEEFYHLENILCDFIYEIPHNQDGQNDFTSLTQSEETNTLTPDCDYSALNKDLYNDDSLTINIQQPAVANYLELYDIQRSLPSLKK